MFERALGPLWSWVLFAQSHQHRLTNTLHLTKWQLGAVAQQSSFNHFAPPTGRYDTQNLMFAYVRVFIVIKYRDTSIKPPRGGWPLCFLIGAPAFPGRRPGFFFYLFVFQKERPYKATTNDHGRLKLLAERLFLGYEIKGNRRQKLKAGVCEAGVDRVCLVLYRKSLHMLAPHTEGANLDKLPEGCHVWKGARMLWNGGEVGRAREREA